METKSINKIKLPKKIVETIVEKYIESRVEDLLPSYYEELIKNLMAKKVRVDMFI